jgi:hypothetical protein
MDNSNKKNHFSYTLELTIQLKQALEDLLWVVCMNEEIKETLNPDTLGIVNHFNCELTDLVTECIP